VTQFNSNSTEPIFISLNILYPFWSNLKRCQGQGTIKVKVTEKASRSRSVVLTVTILWTGGSETPVSAILSKATYISFYQYFHRCKHSKILQVWNVSYINKWFYSEIVTKYTTYNNDELQKKQKCTSIQK